MGTVCKFGCVAQSARFFQKLIAFNTSYSGCHRKMVIDQGLFSFFFLELKEGRFQTLKRSMSVQLTEDTEDGGKNSLSVSLFSLSSIFVCLSVRPSTHNTREAFQELLSAGSLRQRLCPPNVLRNHSVRSNSKLPTLWGRGRVFSWERVLNKPMTVRGQFLKKL